MPEHDRRAFYTDAEGPDIQAIARGLLWLGDQTEATGAADGWLVVNTLDALTGIITEAIGERAAKQLAKGEVVRVGRARVRCYSHKTLPPFRGASAVLVLHPATDLLDKLDSLSGIRAIAVIPWIRAEVSAWVATWEAVELSGKEATAAPPLLSPVFEAAMSDLTARVNLSTGIGHPNDHDAAVHTFEALRDAGEPLAAAALKAWLLRHGWSPSSANKVVDVAERLFAGRTVQVRKRAVDSGRMLQRWRDIAEGKTE